MPKKDPTYERIERALFKDKDEATTLLSPREMEIKKRMMLCVSQKNGRATNSRYRTG